MKISEAPAIEYIDVKEKVENCVLGVLHAINPELAQNAVSFDENASLSNIYGINSISMVSLIMTIENETGITFSESDLTFDNFFSIHSVANLVLNKLTA